MRIFAPFLNTLLEYATYQNQDANTLRHLLSNREIDLCNHEETIEVRDYLAIFNEIIAHSKNDSCGLSIGAYLNLNSLGLILEISLNTSSIEQGVSILQDFLKSKFPIVSASVIKSSKFHIVQLDSSVGELSLKKHLLDMVLCIIYRELKLMLPDHIIPRIRLPYSDSTSYINTLKIKITHNTNYQIVLPSEIENTEINKDKVKQIELLLPKFMAMLNQSNKDEKKFSSQIRNMTLNMCSPEIPNFDQVQKQFPYSKRTVQRKLTDEGISFRGIVNTIKEELSNYLMNEKHLKTKDIAYILGYSESSSYLHAVKSWKIKNR